MCECHKLCQYKLLLALPSSCIYRHVECRSMAAAMLQAAHWARSCQYSGDVVVIQYWNSLVTCVGVCVWVCCLCVSVYVCECIQVCANNVRLLSMCAQYACRRLSVLIGTMHVRGVRYIISTSCFPCLIHWLNFLLTVIYVYVYIHVATPRMIWCCGEGRWERNTIHNASI